MKTILAIINLFILYISMTDRIISILCLSILSSGILLGWIVDEILEDIKKKRKDIKDWLHRM